MEIKELDKKQLVLLTLLITFIVSIATGIITVSLMEQAPKSVPQTINNIIQKTIEKVTAPELPQKEVVIVKQNEPNFISSNQDSLVSIYSKDSFLNKIDSNIDNTVQTSTTTEENIKILPDTKKELGTGIIISDIGLILVDTSILNQDTVYRTILNNIEFDATVLKKYNNGFTILKISKISTIKTEEKKIETKITE